VAYGDYFRLFDVSDPANITLISSFQNGSNRLYYSSPTNNLVCVTNSYDGLLLLENIATNELLSVGEYITGGVAEDVTVDNNYAYVADRGGIQAIDLSIPTEPSLISRLSFSSDDIISLVVQGDFAYVVEEFEGLHVINISEPSNLVEVGFLQGSIRRAIAGNGDYIFCYRTGFSIIDVSEPSAPVEVSNFWGPTPYPVYDIVVRGSYAYVVGSISDYNDESYGFSIIDIANPYSPQIASGLYLDNCRGIAVNGSHAFVIQDDYFSHTGLAIIDYSNRLNPVEIEKVL